MIPKVIHYCWFGGNPLPESARQCIASWRKYMPGYEIKEWNESNFDVASIAYTREAYRLKKYAFVSDYARFCILYREGGLYFDTDVELIAPLHNIVERGPFMGCEARQDGHDAGGSCIVAPGLGLGAPAGLELYGHIIDWYRSHHFVTWDGKFTGTVVDVVSNLLASLPARQLENGLRQVGDIFIYPPEYFCPKNYFTGELHITPATRSIHHYAATWVDHRTLWQRLVKRVNFIRARYRL